MSLSVEAIRDEVAERRERVAEYHRREAEVGREVARLEDQVARRKAETTEIQAALVYEQQTIEALENAAALLAEHLPVETPVLDPISESRDRAIDRARREREEEVGRARRRRGPEAAAELLGGCPG